MSTLYLIEVRDRFNIEADADDQMNIKHFLKKIDDRNLLGFLKRRDTGACIVGDEDTVEFIATAIGGETDARIVSYKNIDNVITSDSVISNYIVCSCYELSIVSMVRRKLQKHRPDGNWKIRGLFGDVFSANCAGKDPFTRVTHRLKSLRRLGYQKYIILSTPRSGSSYLSDLLTKTNLLGFPREHLRQDVIYLVHHGLLDLSIWLATITTGASTPNKMCGTKIISHFMFRLYEGLTRDEKRVFDRWLHDAKVIYLQRQDKVAQAISYFKATESGIWHRHRGSSNSEGSDVMYDYDKIRSYFDRVNQEEGDVARFIETRVSQCLELRYEDLMSERTEWRKNLMEFLEIEGLDLDNIGESGLLKLSDESSQDMYEWFLAGKGKEASSASYVNASRAPAT